MSLTQQLIRHEGLRLKPYRDSVGKLTIGVGHNLDDKGINEGQAMLLLEHDIFEATHAVMQALPWIAGLNESRRNVLVNMAFNMGVNGLLGFRKMLAACEDGHYGMAAKEMMQSRWADQVGVRAIELSEQMRSGLEV